MRRPSLPLFFVYFCGMKRNLFLIVTLLTAFCGHTASQEVERTVEERLKTFFKEYTTNSINIGTCKMDSFHLDFRKKKLFIYADERFAYQPLRPEP